MRLIFFLSGLLSAAIGFVGVSVVLPHSENSAGSVCEPVLTSESSRYSDEVYSQPQAINYVDSHFDSSAGEAVYDSGDNQSTNQISDAVDIISLAKALISPVDSAESYEDIWSIASSLDSDQKRDLAEEIIHYHNDRHQNDVVRLLMDEDNDIEKTKNAEYLFRAGLADSSKLVLIDVISQSETLQSDQDISHIVESIAFSSSNVELKAAALSAVVPTDSNKDTLLTEVKTLLSSGDSSAENLSLRASERLIFGSGALITQDEKLGLKTKIMSIANNHAADIDNRIKALSLSTQL